MSDTLHQICMMAARNRGYELPNGFVENLRAVKVPHGTAPGELLDIISEAFRKLEASRAAV